MLQGANLITADSRDSVTLRRVFYTGSDALYAGYLVCFDRDNATATNYAGTTLAATSASGARAHYVEKPSATNLFNFAGIVTKDYPAVTGGQFIAIQTPEGSLTNVYTDQNCTINTTLLTVQAGSYAAGGIGEGPVIGRAVQTVDRSSTNGVVQAIFVKPDEMGAATGLGTPSSSVNVFSSSIWGSCPWDDIAAQRVPGIAYFNDFTIGTYALANNQTTTDIGGGVRAFTAATAGTAITKLTTNARGILHLESTTDNEDAGIMIGGGNNTAGSFIFNTTTKLWMEARISSLNITDSKYNEFIGFAEEALNATTALITASDALADKDLVGFQRVFADGDKLDVVHNTAGGGGVTTAGADAATVVADTFHNVGLYCDGTSVFFYQNNVLVDTVLLSATNFPDGQIMAFYYALMLGHGDTASNEIDWVRIAQLF